MAECRKSELITRLYPSVVSDDTVNLDVSDWTNSQDSDSHWKRSKIINTMMRNCKTTGNESRDHLRAILESGWDVNEVLDLYSYYWDEWVQRTALHEAARLGWIEGVKILLDAGAKCITSDASLNPLALALQKPGCHPELIELLLKHGADPNDHDDQLENIPLLNAIKQFRYSENDKIIVQLLLQHGANPNVSHMVNIGGYGERKLVQKTALHEAAEQGWTEGVKMLLDAGAKCTSSDGFQNPLVLSLRGPYYLQNYICPTDLIKLLLKHGADPNDHDDQLENIPLMNAIGHKRCWSLHVYQIDPINVQLLLERGANPNVICRVNIGGYEGDKWVHRTALHQAAEQQQTGIMKMLLDTGAKCKRADASQNPLALALQKTGCHPELIELLLKNGADPNNHDDQLGNIPLCKAITNSRYHTNDTVIGTNATAIVQLLLDAGAKCKTSGALPNPLMLALQNSNCHPDLIKLLVEYGADPNSHTTNEDIPLIHAIINCKKNLHLSRIVQLLLEHGANPNVTHQVHVGTYRDAKWVDRTALHEAVLLRETAVVKLLFDAGAKCTRFQPSESPLALAVQDHNCPPDLIELLLKHGADPDVFHPQRLERKLFHVIENCRFNPSGAKIVALFLKYGTNPNMALRVKIGKGRKVYKTAIHEAASHGLTDVVKILLDAGAICTMDDASGELEPPLMLALRSDDCSPELIELLLKHGADANYHKTDRETRCHSMPVTDYSNYPHLIEIVQLLSENGLNQNAPQRRDLGIPLLHVIANYRSHQNSAIIFQLLLEYGANPNLIYTRCMGRIILEQITALREAALQGWTEGVKMLLNAGAKCKKLGSLEIPNFELALKRNTCQPELIKLLLEYGDDFNAMPGALILLHRLSQYTIHGQRMFLQQQLDLVFLRGGNINMEDGEHGTVLECAVIEGGHSNSVRWLIRHGADVSRIILTWMKGNFIPFSGSNHSYPPPTPLILLQAGMRVSHGAYTQLSNMELAVSTWLQEETLKRERFDRTTGGRDFRRNLEGMSDQLEKAEEEEERVQSNQKKCTLTEYLTQPMFDVQEFSNLEVAISTWLENLRSGDIVGTLDSMWDKVEKAEEGSHQRQKKTTFPEYWTRQMVDLQEFSDESLHVFPEVTCLGYTEDIKQEYQNLLNRIHIVLEFLSQPQSLQWHCRRCVRENLVSLQPSVVKTLSIPSKLKRYILCHEI